MLRAMKVILKFKKRFYPMNVQGLFIEFILLNENIISYHMWFLHQYYYYLFINIAVIRTPNSIVLNYYYYYYYNYY